MKALSQSGRFMFWFFSIGVPLVSLRFVFLGVAESYPNMLHHLPDRELSLVAHIAGASVALLLMPFQFWRALRNRRKPIHRWIGRLYVLAVMTGAASGLHLALTTNAGPVAAAGFALLAILWAGTTILALRAILLRQIGAHQSWMLYSAALTFAAVTLRIQLPASLIGGLDFEVVYPIIAWSCWLPNLIIIHFWQIRRRAVAWA